MKTHAQNRHQRRIENRNNAAVRFSGEKGSPIQGELTATEKAHKARRRERRLKKAIADKLRISQEIQPVQTRLHALSKAPETPDNLTEIEVLKSALKRFNKFLSHAEHLISVLS